MGINHEDMIADSRFLGEFWKELSGPEWHLSNLLMTTTHFGFVRYNLVVTHFLIFHHLMTIILQQLPLQGGKIPPPLQMWHHQTVQWRLVYNPAFPTLCLTKCPWCPLTEGGCVSLVSVVRSDSFTGAKGSPRSDGPFITQSQPHLTLPQLLSFAFYLVGEGPLWASSESLLSCALFWKGTGSSLVLNNQYDWNIITNHTQSQSIHL